MGDVAYLSEHSSQKWAWDEEASEQRSDLTCLLNELRMLEHFITIFAAE